MEKLFLAALSEEKKKVMKHSRNKLWFFWLLCLCFAPTIYGQSVSLTSGGFAVVSGEQPGTPLSSQTALGTGLESHLNFGNVAARNSGGRVRITIPLRISATSNYKLELQRSAIMGLGVQPQDIGFGVLNPRPQTGNNPQLTSNATSISISGNFAMNPASAPVVNGVPQFAASLNNILDSPTTVLTGVPTVADGTLGEDANSILVDLTFVIAPQYFTASDMNTFNLMLMISPTS